MSRLHVAPIVEGHGEVGSIRILLERTWREVVGGEFMEVLQPIREKKGRLAQNINSALCRATDLAIAKLGQLRPTMPAAKELILVLVDADDDLPCVLGPQLLDTVRAHRADANVACVIANIMYETWFVAAAASLAEFLDLGDSPLPEDPEGEGHRIGWIERRFRRLKYSKTVDQPRMTARMDLTLCRRHSPSFDKLCRELERNQ